MASKLAGLIIFIAFLSSLLVAYYTGVFTTNFNSNLCYSDILSKIKNRVIIANEAGELEKFTELEYLLKKLPLHGYETNCSEVKRAFGSQVEMQHGDT